MRENWEEPYMIFWNKYFPEMTIEKELEMYTGAIMSPSCPDSEPYPGITELIKKLKNRGNFLAVISFDLPATVLPEIKKFGLENIFDQVITYATDKGELIKKLIKRKNLNPKETIFIGDGNHEIESGKKVGTKTIAVAWGLCTEKRLKAENPDYLAHNIKELENILLS
jgi:HAD superfamily hydrolase (TIGR01509 family)